MSDQEFEKMLAQAQDIGIPDDMVDALPVDLKVVGVGFAEDSTGVFMAEMHIEAKPSGEHGQKMPTLKFAVNPQAAMSLISQIAMATAMDPPAPQAMDDLPHIPGTNGG